MRYIVINNNQCYYNNRSHLISYITNCSQLENLTNAPTAGEVTNSEAPWRSTRSGATTTCSVWASRPASTQVGASRRARALHFYPNLMTYFAPSARQQRQTVLTASHLPAPTNQVKLASFPFQHRRTQAFRNERGANCS